MSGTDKGQSARQGVVDERERDYSDDWRNRYVGDRGSPLTFSTISVRNLIIMHAPSRERCSGLNLRVCEAALSAKYHHLSTSRTIADYFPSNSQAAH